MKKLTSNKTILVTVILSLLLLSYFYIFGNKQQTLQKPHVADQIAKTTTYTAFQDAQTADPIYITLTLNGSEATLKLLPINTDIPVSEIGTYESQDSTLTVKLNKKDGRLLSKPRMLRLERTGDNLVVSNTQEAGFGPLKLYLYKTNVSLANTSWYWQSSEYANKTQTKPKNMNQFKLSFKSDDTFSSTTDCNNVSGKYYIAGSEIKFSSMISTLMMCDKSVENDYIKDLRETYTFRITNDDLFLTLQLNSGTMKFKKVN